MNSEELEKSLRTEFGSYLRDALADMRQEVFQLQYKLDSELEKYKTQIDDVFKEFSEKVREDTEVDENFKETIVEHLRLARDDGATITATAIAKAEKLEQNMTSSVDGAAPSLDMDDLRDAVNDISSQTSQATILKALINHAEQFVPRGAFFVVKNQNFVGWRVFGNDDPSGDDEIREIYFETAKSTILGNSVNSLQTVESTFGSFEADNLFLGPLGFGEPKRMFAVPLIARGRGVAGVYADEGESGSSLNIAALETLVRIAGLTVELLAASQSVGSRSAAPAVEERAETQPAETETVAATESSTEDHESYGSYDEPAESEPEETYYVSEETEQEESVETPHEVEETEYSYEAIDEVAETAAVVDDESIAEFEPVSTEETYEVSDEVETSEEYDTPAISKPTDSFSDVSFDDSGPAEEYAVSDEDPQEADTADLEEVEVQESQTADALEDEFVYDEVTSNEAEVSEQVEMSESPAETVEYTETEFADEVVVESEPEAEFEASDDEEDDVSHVVAETQVAPEPVATPPVRSRLAGRNVDLPIEVDEQDRKLHNDARRFARLLVSEIKLYNEQKVVEGRSSGDLYERLREAIDRSREMYDKRVQPPVAERFDYFHYEVVNTLVDGEETRLGSNYPGSTI